MFTKQCLLATILALASKPNRMFATATEEIYLYTIYYEESDCGRSAVSIAGKVSTNEEYSIGGWDNTTEQCSMESTCVVNNTTDICQNQLVRTGESLVRADIGADGRIFECDATNEVVDQALCRVVEGCKSSSKLPHCNFQLATTSDIFANMDLVRNDDAFQNDGLDQSSYMMLYSDESCSEFEGAHGIITGDTPLHVTSESLSCEDAVACAFLPEGDNCLEQGGLTGEIYHLYTQPAASKAKVCSDKEGQNCEEVDPKVCMKSEAFPSCYYQLVTSKELFSDPESYFVGTKFATKVIGDEVSYEDEQKPSAAARSWLSFLVAGGVLAFAPFAI